jgi:hypothetical protein
VYARAPWQHAALLHALLTVHQRTSAACRGSWGRYTAHSTRWPLQFGCLVVNAPTANTIAAAEHGIALLCALTRNVAQADASVKQVGRTVVVQPEVGEPHACRAVWNMTPTMPCFCSAPGSAATEG